MHFCELCAHLFVDSCYYIVFATPHKKKYLLQKSQPIPLAFLLSKNKAFYCNFVKIKIE